jgi:hypothetical protein
VEATLDQELQKIVGELRNSMHHWRRCSRGAFKRARCCEGQVLQLSKALYGFLKHTARAYMQDLEELV